jgi:hypothetical protein
MKRFAHGLVVLGMLGATTTGAQQATGQGQEGSQAKIDKDAPGIIAVLSTENNCFTSGSGQTFLKVCITENGNISWLESPAGARHITTREGYAVCTYDAAYTVHGFDVNMAAEGWGPSIVSENKRIITRTSLDGLIELKQTFTVVPAERGVDVKMELKNLSPATLQGLMLARYFDGDIDGQIVNEYSHTGETIWGKSSRGLLLTAAPLASAYTYLVSAPYSDWNPVGTSKQLARGCEVSLAPSGVTGDYAGGLIATLGAVKPGKSKSVTLHYKRF